MILVSSAFNASMTTPSALILGILLCAANPCCLSSTISNKLPTCINKNVIVMLYGRVSTNLSVFSFGNHYFELFDIAYLHAQLFQILYGCTEILLCVI